MERMSDQTIGTMLRPRMMTTAGITNPHPSGESPSQRFRTGGRWTCAGVGLFTLERNEGVATRASARGEGGVGRAHSLVERVLWGGLVEQHLDDGLAQRLRDLRVVGDGGPGARVG